MIPIEQHLCNVMYKFIKVHTSEIKDTYEDLGFKSKTDMLNSIKVDWETAWWALTELLMWGLNEDYCRALFVEEETDTFTVFKLLDGIKKRYLICKYDLHEPIEIKELKKITKMIEVNTWEDI